MKNVLLWSVSSILFAGTLSGSTFTLTSVPGSLSDWKNGNFYQGGAAPGGSGDDIVVLPRGSTVAVDGSDGELTAFLSGLKVIYNTNAVFRVTVPAGKVAEIGCAVTDNDNLTGCIEKLGGGELKLTAWRKLSSESTSPSDYNVNISVKEGVLRLPDTRHSTSTTYYNRYGVITVDEGAKLISIPQSVWQIRGIHGGGMITNETGSACNIYLTEHWMEKKPFSGVLGGKFSIHLRKNARLHLAGTNNTYEDPNSYGIVGDQQDAVVGIAKFGSSAKDFSSISFNQTITAFSAGMRIVYTGEGETTDKKIYALSSPSYLDAGANGGVVFAGDFATWSTSTGNLQRYLVLDGSNRNECVISGRFDPDGFCTENGTNHWYIAKRGTGTWRFTADDHKHLVGTFAVENGTLAFDSVFQKGVACALGTSTRTYYFHYGALDEQKRSDYAFELGSATDSSCTGLMEYRGVAAAQCLDRPFALVGNGGFRADGGAGPVKYANVTGVGPGAKTLVLDGDSTFTNSVYNVYDGDCVVSVSKRGIGTWMLGGDVDISGGIEVLGGTLIVKRADSRFTRYRFTLKEIADENAELREKYAAYDWGKTYGRWGFNEIGLYDENGFRQNFYLEGCPNRAALAPGQAAFGTDRTVTANSAGMVIDNLFDGVRMTESGVWNGFVGYVDQMNPPNRNKPETWVNIDMYLTNGAPVITHYDLANMGTGYNSSALDGGRTASAFALYGSVDGVNWELLGDEFDEITEVPDGTYKWLFSRKSYSDTADPLPATRHTDGWKLKKTVPERVFKVLDDIGAVRVANGASLMFAGSDAPVISTLKLDADASGSISGFVFAPGGTLELSGEVPEGGLELPVKLEGSSDLGNFATWLVKVNGRVCAKTVRASADRITVSDKGLILRIK